MDLNRGLVRCHELLGHHDAYIHAFGFLRGSPNSDVLEELYRAFCSADEHKYAIPDVVHEWMISYTPGGEESPF